MIPIFDSLCHPTLTGKWLGSELDSTFEKLKRDLKTYGFLGANAVGIHGVENYNHSNFIKKCSKNNSLIPVAGLNVHSKNLKREINEIKNIGYNAVKIHPRFNKMHYNDTLADIFRLCSDKNLIVFYCTYVHSEIKYYPSHDPFYYLINILKKTPKLKLILVHGGDIQLLKYAELVRFNQNLLLDLSLTILKYQGSSIEKDIQFLFKNFDRRICIGTDHPEYSHELLRRKFNSLTLNIDNNKAKNIGYKNITKFLGISFNKLF
tara:strand:+ start:4732 stop:5520 length:789 start_codon:yes stop_codon:yes gene_type:complete